MVALSKFIQAKPESFDNTMKSSRSLQLKSFADKISSDGPHRRRAPPKSTTSLDGNEFRRQLGDNRLFTLDKNDAGSNTYFASKIDVDEPVNAFKIMRMVDTGPQAESFEYSGDNLKTLKAASGGLPGSQHTQPQFSVNKQVTSVDKIEDSSDKRGTASNAPTPAKVKGSPPAALPKYIKKQRQASPITMTWSRSANAEFSTGNTSIDGTPQRRRAPPKSTKSLDGKEFRNQLGHYRVASFHKIDVSSEKRSAASNTFVSAKIKGSPPTAATSKVMQAQPESFDNTITRSRSMQVESSITENTSRDGPPQRRALPQDGNEFGQQLGHNQVFSLDISDDSGIKRGTVANTPTSEKVKSSPSSTSSKSTQAQSESFDNTITWSRTLQLKPTTKRKSRRRAPPKSVTRRKRVQLPARSNLSVVS
jgi:hypothetical protein